MKVFYRKISSLFLLLIMACNSNNHPIDNSKTTNDKIDSSEEMALNNYFITIVYKGGTSIHGAFEKDDPEVTRFMLALDQYINNQPISACAFNGTTPICMFQFKLKLRDNLYQTYWHNFSDFDNLLYVDVSYKNGINTTCKTDRNFSVLFKDAYHNVHNVNSANIHCAWSKTVSNIEKGFTGFSFAWNQYKTGAPMPKKWDFRSNCSNNYTIFYLLDPTSIVHLYSIGTQTQP